MRRSNALRSPAFVSIGSSHLVVCMLGFGRARFPYRRFLSASHHISIRYRPPLSLSPYHAGHMSTAPPIHPVRTSQHKPETAIDKPHADTDITKNGEAQNVKEKKHKEQSDPAYPLEVLQLHRSLIPPWLIPTIYDLCSSAQNPRSSIAESRCSRN